MLLADTDSDGGNDSSETGHRFLFARVLGIYHVNAIFTSLATCDYSLRRLDFLWVRWFSYNEEKSPAWRDCRLDLLHFPPVGSDDAFGFVDPSDVLRGCHIIPAFASGKFHLDGQGISPCATDSHDWRKYYIMRYDMSKSPVVTDHRFSLGLLIVIWLCDITGASPSVICILTVMLV